MAATTWFRHDINASYDIAIQGLNRKYGLAGVGIYWILVEALYKDNGIMPLDSIDDLAYTMHCDAGVIRKIITSSGLFEYDSNQFWSERILRELNRVQSISEIRKNAAKSKWEKEKNPDQPMENMQADNVQYANAEQMHDDTDTNAEQTLRACASRDTNVTNEEYEELKEETIKEESSSTKTTSDSDNLIAGLSPEYRKALEAFIAYRREIKKPMTGRSVAMAIRQLEKLRGEPERIACIEKSIMNGWQGLFPEQIEPRQRLPSKPRHHTEPGTIEVDDYNAEG